MQVIQQNLFQIRFLNIISFSLYLFPLTWAYDLIALENSVKSIQRAVVLNHFKIGLYFC